MTLSNKYNLPTALVSAIENDPYDPGNSDISTTSLVSPPRIFQLKKRHGNQVHEDVSDCIYRLLGQNTHHILERIKDHDCIKERRFYADINDWRVGGQIDLFEHKTATLSDWKVTSVYSVLNGLKPEHEQQLNINAFLMRQNGLEVKKAQIVNLLRDWSKYKAKEHGYPKCQVMVQNVPLWSNPAEWIEARVKLHQEQESVSDDALLPCTPSEKWETETKWAVMKKGQKKALRLLGTLEEAEDWMDKNNKGNYIEERPGEAKRCSSYCDINAYCSSYVGF